MVTAADNSTETFTVTVTIAANTAKDLRPFQFLTTKNPNLSVNVTGAISGNQITAIVPFQTDISALVATFGTTGDKVEVGGNLQESGVTVNNFTAPGPVHGDRGRRQHAGVHRHRDQLAARRQGHHEVRDRRQRGHHQRHRHHVDRAERHL